MKAETKNKIVNFFKKYSFAIWLGASMGIIDVYITSWQYWIVIVPTIFLVVIREKNPYDTQSNNKEAK